MRILCWRCKKTTREFEPTEQETIYFDEEELAAGEALSFRPCEECRESFKGKML